MASSSAGAASSSFRAHFFPIATAALTNGTRYVVCDAIAQQYGPAPPRSTRSSSTSATAGSSVEVDYRRSLSFGLFGALYAGGPGYCVYNVIYPRVPQLFKVYPLAGSIFDCVVQTPLLFFPCFYVVKEIILPSTEKPSTPTGASSTSTTVVALPAETLSTSSSSGPSEIESTFKAKAAAAQEVEDHKNNVNVTTVLSNAWANYTKNFVQDNTAACAVWIPLMWINFKFVPLNYRWPYMSTTGILWAFILNHLQFSKDSENSEDGVGAGTTPGSTSGSERSRFRVLSEAVPFKD